MLNREELLYVGIKSKGIFVSDTQTSNITEKTKSKSKSSYRPYPFETHHKQYPEKPLSKDPEKPSKSNVQKNRSKIYEKDPVEYPENQKPKNVLLRLGIRYQEKT